MSVNECKALKDLNLVDRFLFDEAMEIPELYQIALRIILEEEIELLDSVQTEKELRISPGLRSIRLDVVSIDVSGQIYYTEMQKANTGNLVKRSRYYQSQMDVSLLEPGSVDFNLLNDTCLILIAPFDIFGKGLYRYTFEGVCRECPDLRLEDGATRIFINTRGTNRQDFSQEFLDFMEYLMHTSDENADRSSSERIKHMHRKIQEIRMSEERGVKYMQKWEERVYDRLEGKAEGKAIRLVELIQKKCAKGRSLSQIADEVEEEEENIRRYYEEVLSAPEKTAEEIVEALEENVDEVV